MLIMMHQQKRGLLFVCSLLLLLLTATLTLAQMPNVKSKQLKHKRHLSEDDLRELEYGWVEEEELSQEEKQERWEKDEATGQWQPPSPEKRGGMNPEMCFATVEQSKGVDFEDIHDTKRLAAKWQALLLTSGFDQPIVTIDERSLLFHVPDGVIKVMKLKKFLFEQPEVKFFEWNSQKFYPPKKPQTEEERLADEEKDAAQKKKNEERRAKAEAKKKRLEAKEKRREARLKREAEERAKAEAEKIEL